MGSLAQGKIRHGEQNFSERLRHLLERPGFKAADAARAAKVSPAYISELRSGAKENASYTVVVELAKYFRVPFRWLLLGEGSPETIAGEDFALQEEGAAYSSAEIWQTRALAAEKKLNHVRSALLSLAESIHIKVEQ